MSTVLAVPAPPTLRPSGPQTARSALDRVMQRLAVTLRAMWAGWAVLLLAITPPHTAGSIGFAGMAAGWAATIVLIYRRSGRLSSAGALLDLAGGLTLSVAGLTMLPTPMHGDGSTWVVMGSALSALVSIWVLRPIAAGAATVLVASGFLAGIYVVDHAVANRYQLQTLGYLSFTWLVCGAILYVLRRSADQVDAVMQNVGYARRRFNAERRRLAYQATRDRVLHDHILTVLGLIADNGRVGDLVRLRERCRRALDHIQALEQRRQPTRTPRIIDRLNEIADEAGDLGLEVRISCSVEDRELPADLQDNISPTVLEVITEAVRQAVLNVVRHARVSLAQLLVDVDAEQLTIVVADDGPGFDPADIRAGARGIEFSIIEPMREFGGQAEVTSVPGRGCTVKLTLPLRALRADPAIRYAEPRPRRLERHFETGMGWSIAAIGLGWHLLALTFQETYPDGYRSLTSVRAVWVTMLLTYIALIVARGSARWRTMVVIGASIVITAGALTVLVLCKPSAVLGYENWGLGDVGFLLAYLVTYGRLRLAVTCAVLVGMVNIFWIGAALDTGSPNNALVKVLGVFVGSTTMQGGLVAVYLMLRRNAAAVERAREELDEIASTQLAEEQIAADRGGVYAEGDDLVKPVLRDLADGHADPDSPLVRIRCRQAVSAVLRTYGRNRDTRVGREMRAFAQLAVDRGIDIDLHGQATDISLAPVTLQVMRDLLLQLLTYGRSGVGMVSVVPDWEPPETVAAARDDSEPHGLEREAADWSRDGRVHTLTVRLPVVADRTRQLERILADTTAQLQPGLRLSHEFDVDEPPTETGLCLWIALSGEL